MFARPGLFLFGLTGGVASGKSTVGRILRDQGVHVIDADELARRAVDPGQPALAEIALAFEGVVHDDVLDRAALGKVVFGDAGARARLNAIVHPRVAGLLQHELDQLRGNVADLVVACYEVPLLFENSLDQWLRPTLLVACDEATQVARAMARNGWSREHALARIAAQMPLSEKRKRADYVIENSGDLAALEVNTRRVLDTLIAAIHVQTARQKGSVQ
jgi:dephospho-CoA kinase